MTDVAQVCHAVAGYGLPGVTASWPASPLDDVAWTGLFSCIKDQRLSGLAMQAMADGALPATAGQGGEIAEAHRWWMGVAIELERTLLGTVERLDAGSIDYRILKGSAAAHLDYPDPALRSFGDVDILVRGEQFDAAVDLLVASGHRRRYPQPRPGFDRRFGKGSALLAADGHEIDLHRTFAMGPFGLRILLDDLWAREATFRLASRQVHALALEERFLHACFHAALGDPVPRLTPLRDVAQMLLCQPLDLGVVDHLTTQWHAEPVVARALRTAAQVFGLDDSIPRLGWAARYRPTRAERRAMAVYVDPKQNYAAKAFASLSVIPGFKNRLAYSIALAFPERSYVDQRHKSRLHRWRRGISQVLRSGRP